MPASAGISLRSALTSDALCLSALAAQVFMDTYATNGINCDLANEAIQSFSVSAFELELGKATADITVAEQDEGLVGFIHVQSQSICPVPGVVGPEVLRLYVQAPYQRKGLGRALLSLAESKARAQAALSIWLTAWVGNTHALAFYPEVGYNDIGTMTYLINSRGYENRVFCKQLTSVA